MKLKTATLSAGIAAAIGTAGLFVPTTSSAIIPDGNYRMIINDTPYTTRFDIGTDGAWNSSFTFGCLPGTKGCTSQAMYDKDLSYNGRGSSIEGDGVSGLLDITVSGNSFSVNTFNKDVIRFTAGGDFLQYLDSQLPVPPASPVGTSLMSGTINGTAMTYDPTARLGSVNAPLLLDRKWLIDDCTLLASGTCDPVPNGNTSWQLFSTATASNTKGTVTGTPLSNVGDVSGSAVAGLGFSADGRDDFTATLVTGGTIGSDWGGFFGAQYFEVWNSTIYSLIYANDDTSTTNAGVPVTINVAGNDTTPFPPLTVDSVDSVGTNGGTIVNNGDGTVQYTPPVGPVPPFTDTFTYTISDADPGADPDDPVTYTSTATVTVTVNSADSPNAVDDLGDSNQNGSVAVDVTANDTTPAGTIDTTTVVVTSVATNGGTAVDAATGVVTYSPNTDFAGTDTFGYTVDNSGGFTSNEATVTVTVSPVVISSAGTSSPGFFATAAGSTSGQVSAADVPRDSGVDTQCAGGCYDFVISDLAPGAQVNVFLPPLVTPILAESEESANSYRKLQNSVWVDFDLANVSSGALNAFETCSTNAGDYTAGLNEGDECLMLSLTDGSLTGGDADGTADGSITDPGGIGIVTTAAGAEQAPSRRNFNNTGYCSISTEPVSVSDKADWWLVAGFLALLGWMKRRHSLT